MCVIGCRGEAHCSRRSEWFRRGQFVSIRTVRIQVTGLATWCGISSVDTLIKWMRMIPWHCLDLKTAGNPVNKTPWRMWWMLRAFKPPILEQASSVFMSSHWTLQSVYCLWWTRECFLCLLQTALYPPFRYRIGIPMAMISSTYLEVSKQRRASQARSLRSVRWCIDSVVSGTVIWETSKCYCCGTVHTRQVVEGYP